MPSLLMSLTKVLRNRPLIRVWWILWLALESAALGSGGGAKDGAAKDGHGAAAAKGHGADGSGPSLPLLGQNPGYVHQWIKMPSFSGPSVLGSQDEMVQAKSGRLLVVIFLASWCEPCQTIIGDLQKLERSYRLLPIDIVYVFAHDTKSDAAGFMKEHGMEGGLLATYEALKAYHNPDLPTVYVSDRRGWLLQRYLRIGRDDLTDLDRMLRLQSAF